MALLGNLIARSLKLRKKFHLPVATPETYQKLTLRQLIDRGQYTSFGKHYGFASVMLTSKIDLVSAFREAVPVHTYDDIYNQWWHKCLEGEENVCWPGKVKYFALSSGTSEATSKHIPVTQDMIKSIKKVGFKQLYSMANYKIPGVAFEKGILMLGGTTSLFEKGEYYEGDMSGISARNMPKWMSSLLYKPGKKIAKRPKWEDRIRLIVENARNWDVGIVCGVPAWVQIVIERVIKHHNVASILDIWPNLSVYIHGGVSMEPYRESFKKLFGKKMTYIETYMASEGSFGFQARPGAGIKLVLNAGIFFEFIPFTAAYFDEDGDLKPKPDTLLIHEVKENVEYAVVLSTCSGAWRYLIGDVVKFTDAKEYEIAIVGRTRQFLSMCGEHLSVDNMNKAIDMVSKKMNIAIREFTVVGFMQGNRFAHNWYIGCDDKDVNVAKVTKLLDETLCSLNDDYEVERTSALTDVYVEMLPGYIFIDYLKAKGKYGAMNKFPRVLKGQQMKDWQNYVEGYKIAP
ncbi:MAG: GH3 auxin-responsive promoter family protein [Taibaiella sp.]|nr:GH3 auxin-responsive promoter family protein [Taibaiella sp.]